MTKCIVLFGAGKSATTLINYLLDQSALNNWRLIVADNNLVLAQSKVGTSGYGNALQVQVEDSSQRAETIQQGDMIISLLPPYLHQLVAIDCLKYGKHLLTASYVDDGILSLAAEIEKKGLLFLCEMGLDPGIDHMSAMRLINQVKAKGGTVVSFRSHCGGLVAPETDDNPWHYKISWNPRNIVMAGSSGAVFMENKLIKSIPYEQLFHDCKVINIKKLGQLAYYPNRDSLPYMKTYGIADAATFIRTTLRYPSYCTAWHSLVNAGLTQESKYTGSSFRTFRNWSRPVLPFVNESNKEQLDYLGIFQDKEIPGHLSTSADILQFLLEQKLMMKPSDRDMIVMLHELEYTIGTSLHKTESLLVVKGTDHINTAMATTVGLPLGIAACLLLKDSIKLTGLRIPVDQEIYQPVLSELETSGIYFEETDGIIN